METLILGILGRGTQRMSTDGPWVPTEDLEICDERFAHLPVRVPMNDDSPYSIVGGGWLNIVAGTELYRKLDPNVTVLAYGNRSLYLRSIGAPSESRIMSDIFTKFVRTDTGITPTVHIFNEDERRVEGSGTKQELHNVFALATDLGISSVTLVTVAVHLPRTALMAQEHLLNEFKELRVEMRASESVLLEADPEKYGDRVRRVFGSKSYIRNFEGEVNGINALLSGNYRSIASVVTR